MGHYHCEILIPPTDEVATAVELVLRRFDESGDPTEEEEDNRYAFWDYFVIGGRWSGSKMQAGLDPAKVEAFYEWLRTEKVTISSVQFGKQTLSPSDQREKVDAKWNEMFPSEKLIPCPIFSHSGESMPGDIMKLRDVPERLRAERVIIARPGFEMVSKDYTGPIEAAFMLARDAWNGCNHMPVKWDGSIAAALADYRDDLSRCSPAYRAVVEPTEDWLAVTVDYHS